MNVFEKVKEIILDQIRVAPEKITLDAILVEDLGADSLDAVNVVMALEDEYDISITDEVAQEFKTVKDVVTYIENNI